MTPSDEFTPDEKVGSDYTITDCGEVSGASAAAEAFLAPADTTIDVRALGEGEDTVVLTLTVGSQEHARVTLRMDLSPADAVDLARRVATCADAVDGDDTDPAAGRGGSTSG